LRKKVLACSEECTYAVAVVCLWRRPNIGTPQSDICQSQETLRSSKWNFFWREINNLKIKKLRKKFLLAYRNVYELNTWWGPNMGTSSNDINQSEAARQSRKKDFLSWNKIIWKFKNYGKTFLHCSSFCQHLFFLTSNKRNL